MISCSAYFEKEALVKVIEDPKELPNDCRLLGRVISEHVFYQKAIDELQSKAHLLGADHIVLHELDLGVMYKVSARSYRCRK